MGRKHLYPPSVRHGIPHLGRLPRGWIKTTFGEQLRVVERPVELRSESTYQLVTAKRNRGGIVARETLRGDQILTAGQFRVAAGDFITSNRQIIHGACGIVPRELDGAVVSGEYTVMHPRSGLHLPFFAHYTHGDYFQKSCFYASVGVDVEKMIFDVEQWLKLPFHLPPLPEQRSIAAILADMEIALARSRSVLEQQRRVRDTAVLKQIHSSRSPRVALSDLITSIDAGKSPQCLDRPAGPGEPGVLKIGAVTAEGFDPGENKAILDAGIFDPVMAVRSGDFLVTRANGSKELIGLSCVVETSPQDLFLSDKTFRVSFDETKADKRYVDLCMKSKPVRIQIESASTGGSGSMNNLSQSAIRELRVVLPALTEQRKIAALARNVTTSLTAEAQKLASLERVKTELTRRLLTGELRVKP